jgi:hypothetical protein
MAKDRAQALRQDDNNKVDNNIFVNKTSTEVVLSHKDGEALKVTLNNATLSDILNNQ